MHLAALPTVPTPNSYANDLYWYANYLINIHTSLIDMQIPN